MNVKTVAWTLALLVGLCGSAPVAAQPASTATSPADDTLYRQLGGRPGLVTLVDDLMARLLADLRLSAFFKDTDQTNLKQQLVVQFCEVSGGPCRLDERDMKKVHAGVDIRRADFNALVEVLQHSMDAQGIALGTQNRLLAKLAPMHRDIVNTK